MCGSPVLAVASAVALAISIKLNKKIVGRKFSKENILFFAQ